MQKRYIVRSAVVVLLLCVLTTALITGLSSSDRRWLSAGSLALETEQPAVAEDAHEPSEPNSGETQEPETEPLSKPEEPTAPSKPEPEPPQEEEPTLPTEPPAPEVEEIVITSLPVRMRIPALSLDYEIRSMGADATGTMLIAPELEITSWFDRSAIPGNQGNAILGGHNVWRGVRSQLFNLDDMQIGDVMEIEYADGTTMTFLMESVFVYPLATAPAHLIMDVRIETRVTLITCKGPYNQSIRTSDYRIVAIFKEESVFVVPDPPVERYPLLGSESEVSTDQLRTDSIPLVFPRLTWVIYSET